MNPLLLILGVLGVGIGGYLCYSGWQTRATRNLIESTETTELLQLTPGPVEVVGESEATDDGLFPAPFTDDEVVAASWEIEEWEESGKHSSWRTEGSGSYATAFYLDDGTDRVLVRPEDATLEFDPAGRWEREIGVDEPLPDPIREFLAMDSTPGGPSEAFIKALDFGQQVGDRRYTQHTIEAGEQVYVLGTATRVGAQSFGANDFEIVASADDGHRDAERFIVSNRSESDLIDAQSSSARWRLVGGVLVTLLGVGLLAAGVVA
ncbi:GIDE domain-containing protein [Halosegnis longus]|uniref:RING-type E3 ubiquitin transferase n=1 Tax=Halosegnis longus TaxID=2216012 RepID=A0AAJ4R7X8_9EURY|nr:GIDE domain-containing protein [Halosegnis longus]RNJ26193.1 hypothetical protein Nmn1133_05565 [Salella cibi]